MVYAKSVEVVVGLRVACSNSRFSGHSDETLKTEVMSPHDLFVGGTVIPQFTRPLFDSAAWIIDRRTGL